MDIFLIALGFMNSTVINSFMYISLIFCQCIFGIDCQKGIDNHIVLYFSNTSMDAYLEWGLLAHLVALFLII